MVLFRKWIKFIRIYYSSGVCVCGGGGADKTNAYKLNNGQTQNPIYLKFSMEENRLGHSLGGCISSR